MLVGFGFESTSKQSPSPRGGLCSRFCSLAVTISAWFEPAWRWHCRLRCVALLRAPMQLLLCFPPARTRPGRLPSAVRCSWCCVRSPGIWGPAGQPRRSIWGHSGGLCLLGVCVLLEGPALPAPPALDGGSVASSLGKTWRCFPGSSGARLNYLTRRSAARRGGGTGGAHYRAGAVCLLAMARRCRGQAAPAARLPAAGQRSPPLRTSVRGKEPCSLPPTRAGWSCALPGRFLEQGGGACELGVSAELEGGNRAWAEGKGEGFEWAWDARGVLAHRELCGCWGWGTQLHAAPHVPGIGSFVDHR